MEKLTVEELCKFMKTFAKKEICPCPKVPMYTFRVWLEGPHNQSYDDFHAVEQRFVDFIFDNGFKYQHDETDATMNLETKYIITNPDGDNSLPEGISTLEIIMPGEGYDKHMGKDSLTVDKTEKYSICLHPRSITIMMWEKQNVK